MTQKAMTVTQELVEKKYSEYHTRINNALGQCFSAASPETLYAPARYILEGKESGSAPSSPSLPPKQFRDHRTTP